MEYVLKVVTLQEGDKIILSPSAIPVHAGMMEIRDTGQGVLREGCFSTHGGAGYALGTYIREDGTVVCGACGMMIEGINELCIGSHVADFRRRN